MLLSEDEELEKKLRSKTNKTKMPIERTIVKMKTIAKKCVDCRRRLPHCRQSLIKTHTIQSFANLFLELFAVITVFLVFALFGGQTNLERTFGCAAAMLHHQVPDFAGGDGKIHVKIGVLLEESDHEQANMFIRTIKMINERRDETIRQLLSISSSARKQQQQRKGQKLAPATTTSKRTRTRKSLDSGTSTSDDYDEQIAAMLSATNSSRPTTTAGELNYYIDGDDQTTKQARSSDADPIQVDHREHDEAGRGEQRIDAKPPPPPPDQHHREHEYHEDKVSRAAVSRRHRANISEQSENDNELNSSQTMQTIEKPPTTNKDNNSDRSTVRVAQRPNGREQPTTKEEGKKLSLVAAKNARSHRSTRSSGDSDGNHLNRHLSQFEDNASSGGGGGEEVELADLDEQQLQFNIKLEPMVEFLADGQSALEADGKVCQLIESGVHAIVGPIDGNSIQHVQSICDNLEIPYFELRPFVGGTLVAPIPIPLPSSGDQRRHNTASSSTSLSSAGHVVDSSKIAKQSEQQSTLASKQRSKHSASNNALDSIETHQQQHREQFKKRRGKRRRRKQQQNNKSIERHEQKSAAQVQQLVNAKQQQQEVVGQRTGRSPLDNDVDQQSGADLDSSIVFQFNRSDVGVETVPQSMTTKQQQQQQPQKQRQKSSDQNREDNNGAQRQLSGNFKSSFIDNDKSQSFSEDDDGDEQVEDEDEDEDEDGVEDDQRQERLSKSASEENNNNNFIKNSPSAATQQRTALAEDYHLSTNDIMNPSNNHFPPTFQQQQQTESINNKLEDLTINLYPPSHLLTSAYIDMIYALNWTSFAIVYEDGNSMIKLQDLLKESSSGGAGSGSWSTRWKIRLFRYDSSTMAAADNVNARRGGGDTANLNVPPAPLKQKRHNVDDALHFGLQQHDDAGAGLMAFDNLGDENGLKFVDQDKLSSTANDLTNLTATANGRMVISEVAQFNSIRTGRAVNYASAGDTFNDDDSRQQQQDLLPQQDAPAAMSGAGNGRMYSSGKNKLSSNTRGSNSKQTSGANSFRDVFWRIKLTGEQNILLDVRTENLYEALKQAQQVGCMTEEYSYLITSLDLHTIDLEDFKYSRTKLTGFSLIQVAKHDQSILRETTNGGSFNGRQIFTNDNGDSKPIFDEKYLESLGIVHLIQQSSQQDTTAKSPYLSGKSMSDAAAAAAATDKPPLPISSKQWLSQLASEAAANNDQARRELLQSSPASLSLLPTVDRLNEQKLFDFFLQQQEQDLSRTRLATASAILHDSLLLYMMGLNELDPKGKFLGVNLQPPITCSLDSQPWSHGSSMVNYMRQISFSGLTGRISFDPHGLRTNFKLDVMGMAPNLRLVKVGEWHSKQAIDPTRRQYLHPSLLVDSLQQQRAGENGTLEASTNNDLNDNISPADSILSSSSSSSSSSSETNTDNKLSYEELSSRYELEFNKYTRILASGKKVQVPYTKRVSPNGALLVNEIIFERLYHDQADQIDTLIVTAKLSQPYFMLKETPNKLDGNDQFEGYAVDLIHELSKLVNFKYKWREVADKKYGSKEVLPNGTIVWNGMIGEIVRGVADLAIVDLTITAQREEAVDFTLPFMNTGISILFKKPTTKVTTLFSFLSPFSSKVWAYVLAAYCGISAILYLVGHLSPYEWADPHPCRHITNDDDAVLKNQFSLLNSFWFTIGSLMQQGSDLTPRSMSTRTIAGIWYFFTLIMISSYTANLAAFLTVEKVVYPIENVRDLSNQQEIKYGCVESGSTCLFFQDSQIDTYKKINENMRSFKSNVRSNDEGQKRVGEGKFAFFMESTTIEYIVERNCNLTQIGGLIDSKGYGLATSKKSRYKRPYRTLLNEGILHLQETGMLHVLKNRWWKERRGGGTCTDDGKGGGVTELSLANVGGVFVVLLGGLGISFLVAIAEFMWRARRSGSSRDRMCEEMMNDLKFALACKSSTKPNSKLTGGRGGGGGSRSNRVAPTLSQQNSIVSQYQYDDLLDPSVLLRHHHQQQQPHLHQPFNTKECDPILLHAMLTMLMQQQQQQQQSSATSAALMLPLQDSLDADKQIAVGNTLLLAQQQQPPATVFAGSSARFIDDDEGGLRGAPEAHTQHQQQHNNHQPRRRPREYNNNNNNNSGGKNNNWSQDHHALAANNGRRRTLQSQQTIDLADDNLSSSVHHAINHFN